MDNLDKRVLLIPVIAALVIALGLVTFFIVRAFYNKKHFVEAYYKTIYRIAVINDYYLINHFVFSAQDSSQTKIDHILFGDKFIYIITSKLYDGDISGKSDDKSLVYVSRKQGKTFYTENPLIESKNITTSLSLNSGVDADYFIGITLVEDGCNIGVESNSKQFYIIQQSKLASLIKAIESRPLGKMNEKKLHESVLIIDRLNQKNKQNG